MLGIYRTGPGRIGPTGFIILVFVMLALAGAMVWFLFHVAESMNAPYAQP